MRSSEARLAEVEVKVDTFRSDVGELKGMIAALGDKMDRRFDAVDRRFEAVDRRFDTGFRWLIGVQLMTLVAIIAGLFQVVTRLVR